MKLIGIAGLARSGKDTGANYLCSQYNMERYSFATPMKAAVKVMFNLTDSQIEGPDKEKELEDIPVSPRRILQTLGTEWGRQQIVPDLWIRLADKKVKELKGRGIEYLLITDIRLEEEAEWIRNNDGEIIHIFRHGAKLVSKHSTENGVEPQDHDYLVSNNSTYDCFYHQLDLIIRKIQEIDASEILSDIEIEAA